MTPRAIPSLTPTDAASSAWHALLEPNAASRRWLIALTIALVAAVGLADFYLGFELSLQVFYIVPVCFAVAAGSWRFGLCIALMSVASTLIGDRIAGAHYLTASVPWANAAFALGTYCSVVWLLQRLLKLQRELEERVRQRTTALQSVIAERERLEKAILEIGERERRAIGHDLHDGLGQHLTGTALAGQVTLEKLRARNLPEEEAEVQKLIDHIQEGIDKTRQLAKGLLLAEIQPGVLYAALRELAAETSEEFRLDCTFRSVGELELTENASATNLFHIAKEAVHNAIRHGRARQIEIQINATGSRPTLTIADNGTGFQSAGAHGAGLGLSIMKHRAEIIGWDFAISARPNGGTVVTCAQAAFSSDHE